jgi:AraC-like DNA-binding protein
MNEYEKRGYLLENFRLFHLQSSHHAKVDFHYHEFCKLVLLVSGRGAYTVDGQRYLLRPGDTVIVGSRSIHRPELEDGSLYERIIIYISPEFLQKESTPDCDLAEIFSGKYGHVLRPGEVGRKKIFTQAQELERELSADGYGRGLLSNTALLRLLVRIGREQRREETQNPQPVHSANPRVRALMDYIDAHLAEDLDIDALAENFYVSKFHMMRQFNRETGMTIHGYLSQKRLLHARELIARGMRATEACYRSGWRSYSSFTRAYGKHFGTTPTGRVDAAREREESYE